MHRNHCFPFLFLLIMLILPCFSTAQNNEDSVIVNSKDTLLLHAPKDTSGKNVLALDTTLSKKHDPKKAILRSAILPGWGQAYNKKYWKIPIIYAALGTTTAVFLDNINTYNDLRKAVIYKSDTIAANDELIPAEYRRFNVRDLQYYRNAFRQYIDYSVLVFLLFWGLNVVDAAVDAHLKAFDVGSDLSLKIKPGVNYLNNGLGVSLVLSFKENKTKAVLPPLF